MLRLYVYISIFKRGTREGYSQNVKVEEEITGRGVLKCHAALSK